MNTAWVDRQLAFFFNDLRFFKYKGLKNYFLNPDDIFYTRLETGEEDDLQEIVNVVARHIGVNPAPKAVYEWGIKMELEHAGQINLKNYIIQIPMFFVGKKYALGAIIAHELVHAYLAPRIFLPNHRENELLTDLGSLYVGLGKLIFNGVVVLEREDIGGGHLLGYLSLKLLVYAYNKINNQFQIEKKNTASFLTPTALKILESHSSKN